MLQTVDTPIAVRPGGTCRRSSRRSCSAIGPRFRYLLAINGAYIAGARTGLVGAGRRPDDPPFGVAAGDGDASEFERIRAGDYQKASIAEPLYLQGWQLVDELNRARGGAARLRLRRAAAADHQGQRAGRRRVRSRGRLSRQLLAHLGPLTRAAAAWR